MEVSSFKLKVAILACGLAFATSSFAMDIIGAGASFPYPIYSKWAESYNAAKGIQVNYQSIGSGGGIKQISNKVVDFGASDKPLTAEELKKDGLMQFPTVVGGVVPVFNVPGIKAGELKLDGELLANIFLGKVKKWDDAAIKALNPEVNLPSTAITVVHRSDGSGTTFLFANYLSKVSKVWADSVGANTSVKWPAGVGGKGNEGVASYTKRIKGAIGYVEYAYAKQNDLPHVAMKNQAGKFTEPSIESFQAAALHADWKNAPGFYEILTNEPGDTTWPIAGATFILMHEQQAKPETAKAVLEFFDYSYKNGSLSAKALDYVPMPKSVIDLIEASWTEKMKAADGSAVWK
jgi:phosphate transport system substrate-binding protein